MEVAAVQGILHHLQGLPTGPVRDLEGDPVLPEHGFHKEVYGGGGSQADAEQKASNRRRVSSSMRTFSVVCFMVNSPQFVFHIVARSMDNVNAKAAGQHYPEKLYVLHNPTPHIFPHFVRFLLDICADLS